jgi:hypothetical protein
MAKGQAAEVLEVVRQMPRQLVVDADDSVFGYRSDYRNPSCGFQVLGFKL